MEMKLHGGSRSSLWQCCDTKPSSLPRPPAGQGRSSWSRGKSTFEEFPEMAMLISSFGFHLLFVTSWFIPFGLCVKIDLVRIALKNLMIPWLVQYPWGARQKEPGAAPSNVRVWIGGGIGYLEQRRGFSAAWLDAMKEKRLKPAS